MNGYRGKNNNNEEGDETLGALMVMPEKICIKLFGKKDGCCPREAIRKAFLYMKFELFNVEKTSSGVVGCLRSIRHILHCAWLSQ